MPVFEDMGPFYRWVNPDEASAVETLREPPSLEEILKPVLQSYGGEWGGVLGFSQGGRFATGLLRESQEGLLDHLLPPGERFQFGILCGAS